MGTPRNDPFLTGLTAPNRPDVRPRESGPANLADILERVLDKGIVIAGDIQINLLEIELLTIRLRLLVASVDRAREMGINWWESDPSLNSDAKELERENQNLRERVERVERLLSQTTIVDDPRVTEGPYKARERVEVTDDKEAVRDREVIGEGERGGKDEGR